MIWEQCKEEQSHFSLPLTHFEFHNVEILIPGDTTGISFNHKLLLLPGYFELLAVHGSAVNKGSHFLGNGINHNHQEEKGTKEEYVCNTDDPLG